jgi:hypothetical protein
MRFFGRFTSPKATLRLEMEKEEFFLGEELKGNAILKSAERFDLERLTVRLNCVEQMRRTRRNQDGSTDEYWDAKNVYMSKRLYLTPPISVDSGFNKKFPFVFRIPISGRESYSSYNNGIEWIIVSAVAGKGRKEIIQRQKILVAKPSASPTKEVIKEVIKEVVMVPCSYCGGLMPNTALFCPNCGARRK